MMLSLLVALILPSAFADSVQALYARNDAAALKSLCADADRQAERLLCQYRLYPLTEDERYLDDLPTTLEDASATEIALLAGLWGYRASRGSMLQTIRSGRRASALLEHARDLDADDPYFLLIEGQSLLFRPALFGGDAEEALSYFRRLRTLLDAEPRPGISAVEVDVWIWFAMDKMEHAGADAFRRELLRSDPPPLYRAMLTSSS